MHSALKDKADRPATILAMMARAARVFRPHARERLPAEAREDRIAAA